MKTIGTTNPPAATAAASPKTTKKQGKTPEVDLSFTDVQISKWNRSFGAEPDNEYVQALADDIKRNGLIHPVTLVPTGSSDAPYAILAGANRFWALRKLRGNTSGLRAGEYNVRTELHESDPHCLDVSLSENGHRRQPSVIETARYVDRLLQEEHIDQKRLAPKLHISREAVNRLGKLVRCFDQLPEVWRSELSCPPDQDGKAGRTITLSHWVEAAGSVSEDGEIAPFVLAAMETAAKERWSTLALRKALKVDPADGTGDQAGDAGHAARPANPARLLEQAGAAIQAAAEAIQEALPTAAQDLQAAAAKVEDVLKQVVAAKNKAGAHQKKDKKAKAA